MNKHQHNMLRDRGRILIQYFKASLLFLKARASKKQEQPFKKSSTEDQNNI